MKERPIIMTGHSVRAILDGRKTQTRRIVKVDGATIDERDDGSPWPYWSDGDDGSPWAPCPYGAPGDRLWVRETHALEGQRVAYDADGWCGAICDDGGGGKLRIPHGRIVDARTSERGPWPEGGARSFGIAGYGGRWRPSIHMPRWASRLLLEITKVRVQPLQDITEADAQAEGVKPFGEAFPHVSPCRWIVCGDRSDFQAGGSPYRAAFACLWDEINGDRATWASNPWVWAITFQRIERAP